MARVYSNPNTWRRTLNFGRVTDQDLRPVGAPRCDVIEANQTLAELGEAVSDHLSRKALREVMRIKPLMEARTDKRRRPKGVSKAAFKLYRKLKFKLPAKKKKKKHPATK